MKELYICFLIDTTRPEYADRINGFMNGFAEKVAPYVRGEVTYVLKSYPRMFLGPNGRKFKWSSITENEMKKVAEGKKDFGDALSNLCNDVFDRQAAGERKFITLILTADRINPDSYVFKRALASDGGEVKPISGWYANSQCLIIDFASRRSEAEAVKLRNLAKIDLKNAPSGYIKYSDAGVGDVIYGLINQIASSLSEDGREGKSVEEAATLNKTETDFGNDSAKDESEEKKIEQFLKTEEPDAEREPDAPVFEKESAEITEPERTESDGNTAAEEQPVEGLDNGETGKRITAGFCDVSSDAIRNIGYRGRIELALEVLGCIRENGLKELIGQIKRRAGLGFMSDFEIERINETLRYGQLDTEQAYNVRIAGVVFFIMTAGLYPQDVAGFEETLQSYDESDVKLILRPIEKNKVNIGQRNKSEIEKIAKRVEIARMGSAVRDFVGRNPDVGEVKIFEMLWRVFVTKYGNFSIDMWIKTLTNFKGKKYRKRGEPKKQENRLAEVYAVSYEGRLSKPGHDSCEDASDAFVCGDAAWVAVVADGVGSSTHSTVASKLATVVLRETVERALADRGIATGRSQPRAETKKSGTDWAGLLYYFKFDFVKELSTAWVNAVKENEIFKREKATDLSGFLTTLQFVFGCERFIVCGKIGDGTFFVRKRIGTGDVSGGHMIYDGVSGVTVHSVLTLAHVYNKNTLMDISIFDVNEVSDILIASDGVSGAIGDDVREVNRFVESVCNMPFDARCENLLAVARRCSDVNESADGSGDDCSVAYVHLK